MILQRRVDAGIDEGKDLKQGPLLVVRIDDAPGSPAGIRVVEVAVVDVIELVIVVVLVPVAVTHPPLGIGVRVQGLQAVLLLLFRYLEEEFQDQIAIVHQGALCIINGTDAGPVLVRGQVPLQ